MIRKRARKVAKVLRIRSDEFLHEPCNTPINLREYLDLKRRLSEADSHVRMLIYRTFKKPSSASAALKRDLDIAALNKNLDRGLLLLDHLSNMQIDIHGDINNVLNKKQGMPSDPYLYDLVQTIAEPWQIITGRSVTPVNSIKDTEQDVVDIKINYFADFIINILSENTTKVKLPAVDAIVTASKHWLKN